MAMDLIAIYCDGVASNDSRRAVKEHLAVCPVCSRAYEAYRRKNERRKRPLPQSPEEKYAALARTLRHRQRASNLGVAAVIAASLLLGAYSTLKLNSND